MSDNYISMKVKNGTTSTYKFKFAELKTWQERYTSKNMSTEMANTDPKDAPVQKIGGTSGKLTLNFRLTASTEDLSKSTAPAGEYPTGVKTLAEQISYLRTYFTKGKLQQNGFVYLDDFGAVALEGMLETTELNKENATTVTGTIVFTIGKNIIAV